MKRTHRQLIFTLHPAPFSLFEEESRQRFTHQVSRLPFRNDQPFMVDIAPFSLIEPDDAETMFLIKVPCTVVIGRTVQKYIPQPVIPDLLKTDTDQTVSQSPVPEFRFDPERTEEEISAAR